MKNKKYYNAGGALGVIGVETAHTDGDYTFLPDHVMSNPWIRTEDLYDTYEEAKNNPVARFSE
ncbi:hypothetical protein [Alicyclobacillus acidoterrestris]|uniref:Uncharacterized protein n=2 Tax=root TaxID=1 RepID=A0A9E7CRJ0_ALIAG|nr:hypothetical protein [Alicyclobacillus acidoterrestris]UNO47995.1 hypothetical protein K1I37_15075 [Alicyclobacillus acidoterrestris]WJJ55369.1 hypothetical protein QB910_000125 [Alicyclobacillus phage KKP 3916]